LADNFKPGEMSMRLSAIFHKGSPAFHYKDGSFELTVIPELDTLRVKGSGFIFTGPLAQLSFQIVTGENEQPAGVLDCNIKKSTLYCWLPDEATLQLIERRNLIQDMLVS
jgi:hypothetical protein